MYSGNLQHGYGQATVRPHQSGTVADSYAITNGGGQSQNMTAHSFGTMAMFGENVGMGSPVPTFGNGVTLRHSSDPYTRSAYPY